MDVTFIIEQAGRIIGYANSVLDEEMPGVLTEATEFLRIYAGQQSAYYINLSKIDPNSVPHFIKYNVTSTLEAFRRHLANGLHKGISIERKAQLDVMSDYLSQAQDLLSMDSVHPAAPAMIIGASLEEFLRTWVEEKQLVMDNKKPSIDTYAKLLREREMITKQDIKDITSWTGIRNDAAHGKWNEVSDRLRIKNMLEGVNLFMRKYAY